MGGGEVGEEDQGVVDGELGEPNHVDDGGIGAIEFLGQSAGGVTLMASRDGQHHTPMAALEVGPPGTSPQVLQRLTACFTQGAKARPASDENAVFARSWRSRVAAEDNSYPILEIRRIGRGEVGSEFGMAMEEVHHAGEDEAAVDVGAGGNGTLEAGGTAGRIETVFPDQLVWERQGVSLEIELCLARWHLRSVEVVGVLCGEKLISGLMVMLGLR